MTRSTRARPLVRQLLTGAALAVVVVGTAQQMRPVFVGRTRVAQRVLAPAPARDSARMLDAVIHRSPWLQAPFQTAVASAQFAADRDAFVVDLMATGHLGRERASRIADAAVTRAYRERIPPALVLGVMMTENDVFKPSARSRVGAVGLMQIMPKVWRPTLSKHFGKDLRDDATNVKYGVFILRWMHDGVPDRLSASASYRTALLRYNGCVRGRTTTTCRRYPDLVQRHVVRNARASCRGRSFDECVVHPLWLRRRMAAPSMTASAAW